jgi:hypothetical protein
MKTLPIAVLACSVLWLASPDVARACAVCTGGQTDEVRYAFIWTTAFLSLLPPALIGGLIWFVRRRAREIAAVNEPVRPVDDESVRAVLFGR